LLSRLNVFFLKSRNYWWYDTFFIDGIIEDNDRGDAHDQNTVSCFTSFRNLEYMFVCVRRDLLY